MGEVTSVGSQIVSTFVEAISGVVEGVTSAVTSGFNNLIVTTSGNISNLAIWGLVFGGIGLVIGIVRRFTRKVG